MTKIAFVEDDKIYLKNLQRSVQLQHDIHVIIAASSIEDFFDQLSSRTKLDIIFLDIDLPGKSGIDALTSIRQRLKKSEIIMLTEFEDEILLMQALTNGATGYLVKNFPIIQFPEFIRTLLNGGALISPHMARKLIAYFSPTTQSTDVLSDREIQVLRLISDGNTYAEVSEMLNISTNGVKFHVKNIYKKLEVSNKIEAIKIFKKDSKD